MISLEMINNVSIVWSLVAIGTFILLQYVAAPYGRHIRKGWGPELSNKIGWVLMEAPSFIIILYFYVFFESSQYAALLFILWLIHYFNRTFIFPFRIRTTGKKMPFFIVFSAVFFNGMNAGLNGYYLSNLENYTINNFYNWNFYLGLTLFIFGFISNQISDNILINLRKPNETRYKIPYGYLFKYISCPNHFSEFIQWLGFTLIAWNLPAFSFFIWTGANVIPRALKHHNWYKEKFSDYPKNRKAIFPSIW